MSTEHGIEVVRGGLAPEAGAELVRFWSEHGALEGAAARQRLADVVCVLRDAEGAVAGANSVYADRVELVGGNRFWIYRSFIRPDLRASAATAMIASAHATLEEEFTATGEGPIGVCVPVGAGEEGLPQEAAWPDSPFIYGGRAKVGARLYLGYFDRATIAPGHDQLMTSYELAPGYRVAHFAEQDEVSEQDVIDFWLREAAMPAAEANRRILELQYIAVHDRDRLVGVSTAYLARNPQLDMQLWHFRVFVGGAHRLSNVAVQLALCGRDRLQERFVSGADERGAGVIYEVENEGLRTSFNQALWWPTLLTFIGLNEKGDHVRVRYFPGARAPS